MKETQLSKIEFNTRIMHLTIVILSFVYLHILVHVSRKTNELKNLNRPATNTLKNNNNNNRRVKCVFTDHQQSSYIYIPTIVHIIIY